MSEYSRQHRIASEAALWKSEYGLTADPFSKVDIGWLSESRQALLGTLRHLAYFANQIVLLVGASGAGKTFLLDRLSAEEAGRLNVLRLHSDTLETVDQLIVQLGEGLSLAPEAYRQQSLDQQLAVLGEALFAKNDNGWRTLLVLDDAHRVPEEVLSLLIHGLPPQQEAGYGLILGLEYDSMQSLAGQLGASPYRISLPPWTKAEVRAYVEHMLHEKGWSGSPALQERQVEKLLRISDGSPLSVHQQAPSVLLEGVSQSPAPKLKPASDEKPKIAKPWKKIWLASAAMLLASLGFVYFLYDDASSYSQDRPDNLSTEAAPESSPAKTVFALDLPGYDESGPMVETDIERAPADDLAERDASQVQTEVSISSRETDQVSQGSPVDRRGSDATAPPAQARGAANDVMGEDSGVSAESGELLEAQDEVRAGGVEDTIVLEQAGEITVADTPTQESSNAIGNVAAKLVPPVAESALADAPLSDRQTPEKSAGAPVPESPSPALNEGVKKSQNWLDRQPEASWTIQLLGSVSEQTVIKFLGDHQAAGGDFFYLEATYRGKPWYIALAGIYPDKAAAQAGLNTLPAALRKEGAWIRRVAGLKVASR